MIIYDQEIIKICSQHGSNQLDCEKDEPSTRQEEKTNGTCDEIERQIDTENIKSGFICDPDLQFSFKRQEIMMETIPGWDGPLQRSGRDQICYWRIVGQDMGQSSEQRLSELLSHGDLPKRMFIKVKGSDFSGGVLFMTDAGELLPGTAEKLKNPWEVVLESGKWVRYDLHLVLSNDDLVIENGDLKFVRSSTGSPLNENIGSIQEMAAWLDMQMKSYADVSDVR